MGKVKLFERTESFNDEIITSECNKDEELGREIGELNATVAQCESNMTSKEEKSKRYEEAIALLKTKIDELGVENKELVAGIEKSNKAQSNSTYLLGLVIILGIVMFSYISLW